MKSTLLLCVSIVLVHTISLSQVRNVDSVINKINSYKTDTAKIDLLLANSAFLLDADAKKLIYYSEAELKIARKIDDKKRELSLLFLLSQGNEQIGKIAEAIGYIHDNIKLAKQVNDQNSLWMAKINLGVCFNEVGNLSLSIENYKDCLNYFSQVKDTTSVCICDIALSDAYFKSNKLDSSIYHIAKAEKASLMIHNFLLDYVYTNFAETYYLKKEFKLAKEYALKGVAFSEATNNLYALSAEYLVLSKISIAINDFSSATINVQKGLKLAEQTDFKENLINAYDIYSQLLEKEKRYVEALKYKTLFADTKLKVETSVNVNILQAYENVKKVEEFSEIIANDLKKDAALKGERFIIIITILILIMVICVTLLIYYSRNKHKKSSQALRQKNEQISLQAEHIEELNKLKDRLLSIVSHDLRSPLNNLKGMLGFLVKGSLSQEKFQAIIPQLNKGVNTTLELLENLLQWSKSQLKGFVVKPNNVDINAIAEIQLNLFEKQSAEKLISLKNEIPVNTVAFADKDMIDVVLRNLVANAIKFCNANGEVILSSKICDDYLEVSVTDTGVGIPEENIKKIFHVENVFTTVGTNNEKGTGLGLLLCLEFVEKNNGNIGVESKENVGSRFWFTLPIAKNN